MLKNEYAYPFFIAGKTALEKSIELLYDFVLDYSEEENIEKILDEWNAVYGGVTACIDLAYDNFYNFSVYLEPENEDEEQNNKRRPYCKRNRRI